MINTKEQVFLQYEIKQVNKWLIFGLFGCFPNKILHGSVFLEYIFWNIIPS